MLDLGAMTLSILIYALIYTEQAERSSVEPTTRHILTQPEVILECDRQTELLAL